MFVRDLLQAGDFVTLVPVGIPVTLQYGEDGAIEAVILGHDVEGNCIESMLPIIIQSRCVPLRLTIHAGKTYVRGVFYTDKKYTNEGLLPDCILDDMIDDFKSDSSAFKFYAGQVDSTATVFQGSMFIRQWLTTSGFELLSGYLVPADLTEQGFRAMVSKTYVQFPIIASYIIYHRDGNMSYPKFPIYQYIVGDVYENVDESGNIQSDIYTKERYVVYTVPYTEVYQYNLHPGRRVFLLDGILYSDEVTSTTDVVTDNYTCSSCGRKLKVPHSVTHRFTCTDPQCNSVLYPRVRQLLKYLGLPIITYAKYKEVSDSVGSIFGVLDILDIEEYASSEFTLTLDKTLRAIIPKDVLPGESQILDLCQQCNNTASTLVYYLQNVDKMKIDLDLDPHAYTRFFKWIEDGVNLSDVTSLLYHDRVHIVKPERRFEGPPIFRNKSIWLTGKFFHGATTEVEEILRSYAARIVDSVEDADCVILGDLQEDVDGHSVMTARKLSKPTFTESEFFSKYEIDEDLDANL